MQMSVIYAAGSNTLQIIVLSDVDLIQNCFIKNGYVLIQQSLTSGSATDHFHSYMMVQYSLRLSVKYVRLWFQLSYKKLIDY